MLHNLIHHVHICFENCDIVNIPVIENSDLFSFWVTDIEKNKTVVSWAEQILDQLVKTKQELRTH